MSDDQRGNTPISVNGVGAMMMSGSTYEPNCSTAADRTRSKAGSLALGADLGTHLRRALRLLRPDASAATVHAARKQLKHARAILRLTRDALDRRVYASLQDGLRSAAHSLSELRDSEVLLSTCAALLECSTKRSERAVLRALQRALRLHHARLLQRRASDTGHARSHLRECLQARVPTHAVGWPVLAHGLRRSYRRARKLFKQAEQLDDARLHAWRRQVSVLRYQLLTIDRLSKGLAPTARRCHELADLLGLDRDLFLLGCALQSSVGRPSAAAALKLLRRQRTELRRRALQLGAKLYARKPRRFIHHCERAVMRHPQHLQCCRPGR